MPYSILASINTKELQIAYRCTLFSPTSQDISILLSFANLAKRCIFASNEGLYKKNRI